MNILMNYNFLYGIPAIFLMTMVFTPAFAGTPLTIDTADLFENESHISAKINVFENIPPLVDCPACSGAFGTGVITTGTLAVTTTHPGVYDSELQLADNPMDPGSSSIEHNHYVNLMNPANQGCIDAVMSMPAPAAVFEIDTISFQSPGIAMWPENMYKIWEVPKASPPGVYTDALTGSDLDYVLGSLTGTGFGDYVVVAFDLLPIFTGPNLDAVCVLVRDLGEAEINPLVKIGGAILQIDTTTLLVSGMSTTAFWILPILVSAASIGIVLVRKKF